MKNLDLGKDKISKLLLNFSIPCIISMLVGALYNIVDQIFIGQKVGFLGNAATNVVYPFTVIALALALLIGDGASALFNLALGKKDNESTSKSVGNAICTLIMLSAVLTLIGFSFQNQILKVFGVTEGSYDFAHTYMQIILIGLPFYIITQGLNGIIRSDGSSRFAMTSTLLGAIVNIILDPIFIFKFNMDVKGAAIATIIGQIASFIVTACYFVKPYNFKITKNSFKIDLKIVKNIIMLGISSFITQISIVLVIAVCNNLIVKYGPLSIYGADIPISAIGIVMKVFGIVIAFVIGTSIGGAPIIGYNYGAGNVNRVKETFKTIIKVNFIVGIISFIIFQFFPQFIINIFGSDSSLYNEYALLCFRIYLSGIILTCVIKSCSIYLQSIGKSGKSMLVSLLRDIAVFIPVLIILAKVYGVVGMLWASLIADIIAFIVAIICVKSEHKEKVVSSEKDFTDINHHRKVFNKNVVITIAREYGSGGRYVGKLLANELNIPCYDKEIIRLTAKESGLEENYIKMQEQTKKDFNVYYNNDDKIFLSETNVIKKLAKKPCIIIGRCADYVLKNQKNVYKIYLYSDMNSKINRVVKYYNVDNTKARKEIEKINKDRKKHYNYYTNQKWDNLSNYDIAINVDVLGVEKTVEAIKAILTI